MDAAEFTVLLAQRCSGVWIYLRYVLNELRIGLRRPGEIGDLPSGLHNYYAKTRSAAGGKIPHGILACFRCLPLLA